MKRATLILFAVLAVLASPLQPARASFNVLLAGGSASNVIHIWLTPEGREYVIDSIVPLEVGGTLCTNPADNPNELVCPAPPIAGFEVNADGGDDKISVSKGVKIPVTMRGGTGRDTLLGGGGADKLIGGAGNDRLVGWQGDDLLAGGPGNDIHLGGLGDDMIFSGPGNDVVRDGRGNDLVRRGGSRSAAPAP